MSRRSLELVVARYAEDLAWLRRVPKEFAVTVYNKGDIIPDAIALPNIGREAHTYLHHLADHYEDLRRALRAEARLIRAAGHRAVAFADDNSIVDREVAHLAGLGWFGRNANLLIAGAGSMFVLGCIVTTADYEVSAPVPDGCGTCSRCEPACPTGAIVAPGVIDARRCLAWLMQRPGVFPPEFREALGDRLYGCDDCQEACPPTVRLSPRSAPAVLTSGPSHVDAVELLASSDAELLERHGRWYLADRDPRWLRRNSLLVLGNTAEPGDEAVVAALDRYAGGDDEVLAEHAEWALGQVRRRIGGDNCV